MKTKRFLGVDDLHKMGLHLQKNWPSYIADRTSFVRIIDDIERELGFRTNAKRLREVIKAWELPEYIPHKQRAMGPKSDRVIRLAQMVVALAERSGVPVQSDPEFEDLRNLCSGKAPTSNE